MVWKWLTVVALSLTPALIAGKSAALAAGIGFELPRVALLIVVSVSSYVGMLGLCWLAEKSARFPRVHRRLTKFHTEKAVTWCERWGPWGGLTIGVAFVGPIPILIALKWMKVRTRRLMLPLAVSSVLFTVIYDFIVRAGFAQTSSLEQLYRQLTTS